MTGADMDYCRREFAQRFCGDDELQALLAAHDGPCMPDGDSAAAAVCALVEQKLRARAPLSLLRVGNGEGNAFSMLLPDPEPPRLRAFFSEFNSQNGLPAPLDDVVRFCREVKDAYRAADIIGFRLFKFDERAFIQMSIDKANEYAALGLTYARESVKEGLATGWLRGKFITTAWLHLDLLQHVERLLDAAESVIVITGRSELRPAFAGRLGARLTDFISVPVQGFLPGDLAESHLYKDFPQVKDRLAQDLRGVLVLVGAGLFGKVYVARARDNGAVAIDIGSAFDIFAGLKTRPVHAFIPCEDYNWLKPQRDSGVAD